MKLTQNHKILLAIGIGGGIAWLLSKGTKAASTVVADVTTTRGAIDSAENPSTVEGKIEYILANTDTTASEEKSGFSGDRFSYDPMLGYALPHGQVNVTDSGGKMIIGKEGNLANEIYFNAEGEATDDPTVEAETILSEMTEEEIDLAYNVVKAKKNNPNLSTAEVMNKLGWGDGAKALFKQVVYKRIQDIKSLKKSKKWKAKWTARKERFANKLAAHANRGKSAAALENAIERKGRNLENRLENAINRVENTKDGRKNFHNEIINRESGIMWGGHRGDGQPTNANAYPRN